MRVCAHLGVPSVAREREAIVKGFHSWLARSTVRWCEHLQFKRLAWREIITYCKQLRRDTKLSQSSAWKMYA